MTEREAYDAALAYAKNTNLRFVACYCKSLLKHDEAYLYSDLFEVPPSRLWRLSFTTEVPAPNTVNTGDSFDILVDDETGECQYFARI